MDEDDYVVCEGCRFVVYELCDDCYLCDDCCDC